MAAHSQRKIVSGSERTAFAGARSIGPAPREERFEITVRLRRRTPAGALAPRAFEATEPANRRYMTREEYALHHAANPADIAKVEDFARTHGLAVVAADAGRRSVFLSGTTAQFEAAFGTHIEHFQNRGHTYRGRVGPITLPADVADVVEGVFGLDDRPAAIAHFQAHLATERLHAGSAQAAFTPPQLAQLYAFPKGADGSGQCIGIVELGGGYRAGDLRRYFHALGLPVPKVTSVRVDGATNHPGNGDGADGEVMLDIEVAAAVAPRAQIVVYFAPNTEKGFIDAVTTAIHDDEHRPSAISISWGNPEKNWTRQAMASLDEAFQTAAALGVTICCAAGDAGSGDENPDLLKALGTRPDGLAHADFPGSSPHALCCGGTKLFASRDAIASEIVWNEDAHRSATGGGVSDVFPPPAWQANAGVPRSANRGGRHGRGVPDVAGDADPATGYRVRVDGEDVVIGGTSAVAPLWAALVVLCNQKLGHPSGFLNPALYGPKGGLAVCRDIVDGNNGAYCARAGWDACTGWGSPDGERLLRLLAGGTRVSGRARERDRAA